RRAAGGRTRRSRRRGGHGRHGGALPRARSPRRAPGPTRRGGRWLSRGARSARPGGAAAPGPRRRGATPRRPRRGAGDPRRAAGRGASSCRLDPAARPHPARGRPARCSRRGAAARPGRGRRGGATALDAAAPPRARRGPARARTDRPRPPTARARAARRPPAPRRSRPAGSPRRAPGGLMNRTSLSFALGLPFVVALGSVPLHAAAADLERHPYLQSATPTSITVVWTTQADSTGAVELGPMPDQLDTMVPSAGSGIQHEVLLSGLEPNTRYYYRVLGDGAPLAGGDEAHTFLTPPSVGTRAKSPAWIVGDSGTGGSMQAQVRDAMVQHTGSYPPHIFLHMGDMAYSDGTYDEFTDKFYAPYADVMRSIPVWPTLGNHEGHTSDS